MLVDNVGLKICSHMSNYYFVYDQVEFILLPDRIIKIKNATKEDWKPCVGDNIVFSIYTKKAN